MVLSSALSDIRLVFDAQWDPATGTFGRMPPFVQERIQALIETRQFDSSEYQTLVMNQYPLTTSRTWPPPFCLVESVFQCRQPRHCDWRLWTCSGLYVDS